jgi:hypothetical protein
VMILKPFFNTRSIKLGPYRREVSRDILSSVNRLIMNIIDL